MKEETEEVEYTEQEREEEEEEEVEEETVEDNETSIGTRKRGLPANSAPTSSLHPRSFCHL